MCGRSRNAAMSSLRVVHVNRPDLTPQYPSNRISNTKYSPYSFVAKVRRARGCYEILTRPALPSLPSPRRPNPV